MGQPFVGEIRMVGFSFAPVGWAFCDGSLLAISENETLFNLIGTTYGGDGQQTFAVPDLRGRIPLHVGAGFTLGQAAGTEEVTLITSQIPAHTHPARAQSAVGDQASPTGNVWASSTLNQFTSGPATANMNAGNIGSTGGSQPHDNMMPTLTINFVISLFGVFPSPT
jgi:microcystin-dependent protein